MRLPDVEAIIVPFVKGVAGSVGVATKVPNPRPAVFVRVWANGGAAENRILERVQVTVDAWAGSPVEASELAQDIRHAFLNTQINPLVKGVEEVTRPYYEPDETSDRYRATYALLVRAKRI